MTARAMQQRIEKEFAGPHRICNEREVKRAILRGIVDTEKRSVIANIFCWFVTAVAACFLPNASLFILPLAFRLLAMVGTRTGFARVRAALSDERPLARDYRLLVASLLVGGAAWGATLVPVLAFPTLHPARLLVGGGTLVGMSIIITMLSPVRTLAAAFVIGFLGTFCAGLLITGASESLALMTGMTILFLIFIVYSHASTFGHERSAELLVENRRLGESLRTSLERAIYMADHDSLTGLLNRRAFFGHAKQAEWAKRLAVMIDIDHFKRINDRFGHAMGDLVLERVGPAIKDVLNRHVGSEHIAARLGGEEFAVMFPYRSLGEHLRTTEALHRQIAAIGRDLKVEGLETTASLGVVVTDRLQTLDEALHDADTALYRAKALGRNRTEYAVPAEENLPVPVRFRA
ncbi:MAG: diguanylate cyclase [Erythrobacter sp.]